MDGWIKVWRKIFEHPFYIERRSFSRLEVWLDLLLLANHKDHSFLFGGTVVDAARGDVVTSELHLMERWRWSKSKVRRYIKNLEDERMVIKKADSKKTTISIINYEIYQGNETTEEPQKDRSETAGDTADDTQSRRKEGKNEKKNTTTLAPSDKNRSEPETEDSYFLRVKREVPEILNKHRDLWSKAYPAVDLDQQCSRALAWLISHPVNRKQKIDRFLNSWLKKAQEEAPGRGTSAGTNKPSTKKKTFAPCPQCKKETTQEDLDKFGTCPACFKPLPEEKVKELFGMLGKIGKDIPEKENGMKRRRVMATVTKILTGSGRLVRRLWTWDLRTVQASTKK